MLISRNSSKEIVCTWQGGGGAQGQGQLSIPQSRFELSAKCCPASGTGLASAPEDDDDYGGGGGEDDDGDDDEDDDDGVVQSGQASLFFWYSYGHHLILIKMRNDFARKIISRYWYH